LATAPEVANGALRLAQVAAVGVGGFFEHVAQRGLLLAGGGGAFALLG
jgi:hypothetical protein